MPTLGAATAGQRAPSSAPTARSWRPRRCGSPGAGPTPAACSSPSWPPPRRRPWPGGSRAPGPSPAGTPWTERSGRFRLQSLAFVAEMHGEASGIVKNIIVYSRELKAQNLYPRRIISPPAPNKCCPGRMEVLGRPRLDEHRAPFHLQAMQGLRLCAPAFPGPRGHGPDPGSARSEGPQAIAGKGQSCNRSRAVPGPSTAGGGAEVRAQPARVPVSRVPVPAVPSGRGRSEERRAAAALGPRPSGSPGCLRPSTRGGGPSFES